ncbi:hypothetical protein G6L37_04460 [Agrobacterium rubi]|nr:hypothetical protein [Agrobacterium rubi]NTF24605.1 hypothetical protein [Agrobacterium rubi]
MSTAHFILNREIDIMVRSAAAYDLLVRLARETADRGVLQSTVDTRRAAFQRLERIMIDGMNPLRSRRDATISRSGKTASFESCHVTVMPEVGDRAISRQFRLVAVRLLMAHDEIVVEKLPLQSIFRFHAGEQMFHRGDVESGHFRALATEMLEWHYAIKIADSVLDETDQERFTIPGPGQDGMMLGYLDQAASVPAGELIRFARNQEKAHIVGASPFAPGLFIANTYIGANDIRPDQQDLRDCWVEWRRHFGRQYQLGLERELWPFREIVPAERGHRVGSDAVDAVRAFLLDPRALRSMQNRQYANMPRSSTHDYTEDHGDELDATPMRSVG